MLDKLRINAKYLSKKSRNILFFIAISLMIIALARPVINKKEQSLKQEVTPIIIAIDVSKSMLAQDIFPNRLEFAKKKVLDLISLAKDDALGVILFAKSAFILSPLTKDFQSLNYLVKKLDTGQNFDNGSNIQAVLEASNKLFKNYTYRNLLILSDGANKNDFTKEISYAKKHNIKVYSLATASNKATPIKIDSHYLTNKKGDIVTVKRNENIKKLCLETNGGYMIYSLNGDDIKSIFKDIKNSSKKEQLKNKKYITYKELFYYPLALALFILLFAFSSLPSKKVASLLILSLFYTQDVQASLFDFLTIQEANIAYKNKNYKEASKKYKEVSSSNEGHYNYANALYKEKKYKQALKEYKKIVTSNKNLEFKKLYNMGNAYALNKEYKDAIRVYEKALNIKTDQDTKDNLEEVKKRLQKKKQNKNENKKNKNSKKDSKQENNSEKQKNKQDRNKKEQKNKKNQEKKKDTKQEDKKSKPNSNQKDSQAQNIKKQNQISKMEEKKWLKKINQQQSKVLLRKVQSKNQEDEQSTPW